MAEVADRGGERPVSTARRPVWAIGLLLLVEVVGIVAYGAYELVRVDWGRIVSSETAPPPEVVETLVLVLFVPAVALTLLSALSFLLLRRKGWLMAAISQGLLVATSLWIYAEYEPPFVYPIMAYAVLMILYLNVHDVRAVFFPREGRRSPRRLA